MGLQIEGDVRINHPKVQGQISREGISTRIWRRLRRNLFMLSVVAADNLELIQLDVKTAFLQGDLKEEIYMEQPKGFLATGQEHLVCRLRKSLYALKQAPRQWYKKFDDFIRSVGFSNNRKSTTGYCFKFGNGAISWKSKLQECTATSTTEAKYVAASDAAKETLWLGQLAHTFRQVDSDSAPVVYNDSHSDVALSKNLVHHNTSKHIDVRYYFVQDCVM